MEYQNTEPTVTGTESSECSDSYGRMADTLKIAAVGFCYDKELSILWASRCFCNKAGYSREEFLRRYQTIQQYYKNSQSDFEYIKNCISNAVNQKETEIELITHLPQKNGTAVRIQLSLSIETPKDENSSPIICHAIFHNISKELLTAERQCKILEKRSLYFQWMLDEYIDNAYISDMDTYELLYVNETSLRTLGLPLEKVIGHKCYEVIQGLDSPCPFCTNSLLNEDEFYEWEYYNPFLERAYILKDRIVDWNGHKARLELSHDNLSLEYKLVKKEREQEAIIRTIPGGFARVDASDMRTVLWYAGSFLSMIGYTKEQFENELHSRCTYVHPDDIDKATQIMQRAREIGDDTVLEGRIITRDGKTKILMMTYSYVSSEDSWDGIESFYSVGIDVTKDREEQERQRKLLEDAYQTARVANSAKTNFLSSMSHDIRTPMNAIMGMAEIARANLESPEKVQDCLNKIGTSSKHLLNLINEVLDMSRIESGKIDLTLESVNLPELIQNITDICQQLIDEKHQQFHVLTGKMRHENVIADGDRLQQILMNILSNAIKYTPEEGTITLKINELYSPSPGKSQYEFICIDTGIGIDQKFIPNIFEPFSRAEDPRISKLQGTGLGMTITENIVRMMNGTIDIESTLGKGSKFTVSIPFEFCTGGDTPAPNSDFSESLKTAKQAELSGKHILLAEDNDINREIAVELLRMQKIEVYAVENGMRALEEFKSSDPGKYDAILMDIQMPIMNGYDAASSIRALKRKDAETIPIIALTADAFTADVAKSRSVGMNDHIAKPIETDILIEILLKWIG